MSEEFLKYYNRELVYLRHKGHEFGEHYPKIAARLRLSEEVVEDPHVSRLLEGCAFLTARIRQSLDNAFPQLTEALIGQLFPDFHAPIPSMSIVKVCGSSSATSSVTVPAGERVTITAPGFKECDFITCYETQVLPFDVTEAKFENAPFTGIEARIQAEAKSVLKLRLQSHSDEINIADNKDKRLRFYLSGQSQISLQLYQHLFSSCLGLVLVQGGRCVKEFTQRHINTVGFSDLDKVVPYSKRSFSGTRMLIEYLHFPEKFLFFDLVDLDLTILGEGTQAEFWFYFKESNDWLEKQITCENIQLGCSPVVNLYKAKMKPVRIQPSDYEYQLYTEYMDPESSEVVSLDKVTLRNWNKVYDNLPSYYAGNHPHYFSKDEIYWVLRREDKNWAGGFDEPGREVFVSIVDKQYQLFSPESRENWLMSVEAWCCNRNLAAKIPFGGGLPQVSMPDCKDNFSKIKCLVTPTETIRPEMDESSRWQFAKLLTLNHFSDENGVEALKQVLNLLAFRGTPETKALIEAIKEMKTSITTGRALQNGRVGFCNGTGIVLHISDQILSREQIFLLGNVLSAYFAQFAEINTFTQLSIHLTSTGERLFSWPALAGEKELL
ncbi:type VI secretion system baseplate subunit TssF [Vibrio cincinnatiensis]|uniref:type VI secretion system baseplate subunit TssF n=1 Tax=Vibrio cincinnatiensis TaxID=675 RepID=UPI001EDFD4BF|nr:type VI secretion system baseplate subunit TssF [Vibrio cincinnatiensis]MCG3761990.1 type VI secretion system baseplate subunit TssF [Vibrio cincinnatiensis]